MKNTIKYTFALVLMLTLSSCNEWLKVDPQGQIEQGDMFDSEAGFEDVLNGIYIEMKDAKAYGGNLSYTTIEHLLSSWTVEAATRAEYLGLFNYGDASVTSLFDNIFQQMYFIIAETNAILAEIDEQQSVFTTEGMYEQVKGECLAIRAYVHFDLLRLFGPVPGTETTSDLVLPYVTKLSKDYHLYSTYSEYKTAFETDLAAAKELLAVGQQAGLYSAYRAIRMNVEAMNALDARAKLWFGDEEGAYELASAIISSTSKTLGKAANFASGDYNLVSEQILGLHIYNMYSGIYTANFTSQNYFKGNSESTVNIQLYGNTGTDIRETSLWEATTATNGLTTYSIMKYKVASGEPSTYAGDYRRMPMIRLSEMYFIAIETASDPTEAQALWTEFRTSRNLAESALPETEDELKMLLAAEYRREFFAEGQAFYAYKRLNVDEENFLWLPADATINYVVPLPTDEIVSK